MGLVVLAKHVSKVPPTALLRQKVPLLQRLKVSSHLKYQLTA